MADDPEQPFGLDVSGDSKEDALRVLRALTVASTPPRRSLPARRTLMILTIAVPLLLVAGLIGGGVYLQHVVQSDAGDTSTPLTASRLTVTQTNLKDVLVASVAYAANHQHSLAGVIGPAGLAAEFPSLTFSTVSGSATEVAVNMPSGGALVMTGFQTGPPACFGVLEIASAQVVPVFSGYQVTQSPGSYYFEAPSAGGLCNAVTVEPAAKGDYVSVTGFPTEALP